MLYNKLIMTVTNGKVAIVLDDSDQEDREAKKVFNPVILPGISFIYFPRLDQKTNDFYKNVLIEANLKSIQAEIAKITLLRDAIKACQTNV